MLNYRDYERDITLEEALEVAYDIDIIDYDDYDTEPDIERYIKRYHTEE